MVRSNFLLLGLLLAGAPAAFSGVITYSDSAAWSAATSAVTVVTFEGDIDPPYTYQSFGSFPVMFGPNPFVTVPHPSGILTEYAAGTPAGYTAHLLLGGSDTNNVIRFSLPDTYTAFAIDLHSYTDDALTLTLSSGDQFNVSAGGTGFHFLGFTSTTAFNYVEISQPGNEGNASFEMDNVSFGTAAAAPTPEPGTCGLVALAFLPAAAQIRRRAVRP